MMRNLLRAWPREPPNRSTLYETGEQWLARLPERLRALADLVLGGKMTAGDVAYALAALIDSVENAPAAIDRNLH